MNDHDFVLKQAPVTTGDPPWLGKAPMVIYPHTMYEYKYIYIYRILISIYIYIYIGLYCWFVPNIIQSNPIAMSHEHACQKGFQGMFKQIIINCVGLIHLPKASSVYYVAFRNLTNPEPH